MVYGILVVHTLLLEHGGFEATAVSSKRPLCRDHKQRLTNSFESAADINNNIPYPISITTYTYIYDDRYDVKTWIWNNSINEMQVASIIWYGIQYKYFPWIEELECYCPWGMVNGIMRLYRISIWDRIHGFETATSAKKEKETKRKAKQNKAQTED